MPHRRNTPRPQPRPDLPAPKLTPQAAALLASGLALLWLVGVALWHGVRLGAQMVLR